MVSGNSGHPVSMFQQSCIDALSEKADQLGVTANTELSGRNESYVVCRLDSREGLHVTAWIYVDECMLTHNERSYYFEQPDFASISDLRTAFVDAVFAILRGEIPANSGISRINILRGKRL